MTGLEEKSDDGSYLINESTFEKLGLTMQQNNGHAAWYFDEACHFFSQLGLYNKGSLRDEAVLLSLYDGQGWSHSSEENKT